MIALQITLEQGAQMPARGSLGAAGYDLHAYLPTGLVEIRTGTETRRGNQLAPGERALVPTGCHAAIHTGWYGRVAPRSGLAWKHGIDVLAGVIDSDYKGDIGVVLHNTSSTTYTIVHGERVAQLILERCCTPQLQVCECLPDTLRGAQGYGSSGV